MTNDHDERISAAGVSVPSVAGGVMSRRPRADDWDDSWWPPSLELGTVHDLADSSDDEPAKPQHVLWIPDPEARHSWREYSISPEKPNGKPKERIGFK